MKPKRLQVKSWCCAFLVDCMGPRCAAVSDDPSTAASPPEALKRKDRNMTCYKPATPRALFGLTAVMMTAITLGALVVVPAKLEFVSADPSSLATGTVVSNSSTDFVNGPAYPTTSESSTGNARDHRDIASVATDNQAIAIRNRRPEMHTSARRIR